MSATMTSKERVLTALSLEEPDRVPIAMRAMEPLNHLWSDPFERALILRDRFGIDDFLVVAFPWIYPPSVEEKTTWQTYGEQNDPLLVTEYHTPAGVLRNSVRMTDDYHVERLNLEADQLMPRMVDHTIKDAADVERFRYLLGTPDQRDRRHWEEQLQAYVEFGRREGFPVALYVPSASAIAMKNIGTLEMVIRAMDGDAMVQELLDALTQWALAWIDHAARLEPDIIYYSGVYESTDFWSPTLFRRFFAPIHKSLSKRAHAHGLKYINYITTGIDGIMYELRGLGIDAIYGWDSTPPGDADIHRLRDVLGGEMAFWGGISPTFVVERATPKRVREQVRDHIAVLAPGGGYILCTGGSVFYEERAGLGGDTWGGQPEESRAYNNLFTLFEAGLEYGRFPIES